MVNRNSIIGFLTIFSLLSACAVENQYAKPDIKPDRILSDTISVKSADIECCVDGKRCDECEPKWVGYGRGEICYRVSGSYAEAHGEKAALGYALAACRYGYNCLDRIISFYEKRYVAARAIGYDEKTEKRNLEDVLMDICRNAGGKNPPLRKDGVDETLYYCVALAEAFKKSGSEYLSDEAFRIACDRDRVPSACREIGEFEGVPLTEKKYAELVVESREKEEKREIARERFARRAEARRLEWIEAEKEERRWKEELKEEERRQDQQERAALSSAISAGLQSLSVQMSGQDPTQAELNRQLANIRSVAPAAPSPRKIYTSADSPVRNGATPANAASAIRPSRTAATSAATPFAPQEPIRPSGLQETKTEEGKAILFADEGGQPLKPAPPGSNDRFEYEPGAQFDSCLTFFYDPDMYRWFSFRNTCSENLSWFSSDPKGAGDIAPGKKGCNGQSEKEMRERHPNFKMAVCRYGYIPVNAQGKYWEGGDYRCRKK